MGMIHSLHIHVGFVDAYLSHSAIAESRQAGLFCNHFVCPKRISRQRVTYT